MQLHLNCGIMGDNSKCFNCDSYQCAKWKMKALLCPHMLNILFCKCHYLITVVYVHTCWIYFSVNVTSCSSWEHAIDYCQHVLIVKQKEYSMSFRYSDWWVYAAVHAITCRHNYRTLLLCATVRLQAPDWSCRFSLETCNLWGRAKYLWYSTLHNSGNYLWWHFPWTPNVKAVKEVAYAVTAVSYLWELNITMVATCQYILPT